MKTKISKQKFLKITIKIIIVALLSINTSIAIASEITSNKMIELVNNSRRSAGLQELVINEELSRVAEAKANDMFSNQYFEHVSPEGVTPWFWFDEIGYDYMYAAENLAIDFRTAEGTHKALMESTGHRENILGKNYTEIGIAVVSGVFEGRKTTIVVQEFGSTQETFIKNQEAFFEKIEDNLNKEEEKLFEIRLNNNKAEIIDYEGLVLSEVFSIKNPSVLKKVYAENIYWESVDEESGMIAADSYRIKIKNFLDFLEEKVMETNI